MSRIGDLINELAPTGVEFKTLGDVGEFVRGNGLQKSDLTEEGAPAIHYGQIHTYYGTWTDSTKSYTAPSLAVRLRRAKPGDLVIATTSEDDAAVAKATAWLGDGEVAVSGDAYIYHHTLDPRYAAYFFQSVDFQRQKAKHVTGTKVRRVSGGSLAKIRVPVPPIEVQREIARILDSLSSLGADLARELDAEQQARRRQYAHYRERLISASAASVDWKAMGDIGTFIRGRRFTKNDVVEDGIPSIHYGEIYTHYGTATSTTVSSVRRDLANLRFAQPGDVVIASVGETVEDVAKAVAWLGATPVAIHDDTFLFRSDMDAKFVSYYLQTEAFHSQKNRHVARAKVKRLSGEGLAKISMPTPSLNEQRRIVAILDRFGALENDLAAALSQEVLARRRQYEYYRSELLTFEEAVA